MEILDYVRAKGRLLAILVLLPLLAGGATFFLLAREPAQYRSQLEVTIPTPIASGVSAVGLFIANFRQAIISRTVVDRVAAETGVPADELRNGLEVSQLGQANRMEVLFTGTVADEVGPALSVATAAALEDLALAKLDFQRLRLRVAEEQYEGARAAVDAFSTETGLIFPEDDYRSTVSELRGLEDDLFEAEVAGLTDTVDALIPRIDELRVRRDALAGQLLTFQRLDETLANARSARRDASAAVLDAEAELELARSPELLTDLQTAPLPRTQTMTTAVVLASGAAFALALAILTLPDLLRRPRAPEEQWLGVYVPEGETADRREPTASR